MECLVTFCFIFRDFAFVTSFGVFSSSFMRILFRQFCLLNPIKIYIRLYCKTMLYQTFRDYQAYSLPKFNWLSIKMAQSWMGFSIWSYTPKLKREQSASNFHFRLKSWGTGDVTQVCVRMEPNWKHIPRLSRLYKIEPMH